MAIIIPCVSFSIGTNVNLLWATCRYLTVGHKEPQNNIFNQQYSIKQIIMGFQLKKNVITGTYALPRVPISFAVASSNTGLSLVFLRASSVGCLNA